jgi:hypothetical protein
MKPNIPMPTSSPISVYGKKRDADYQAEDAPTSNALPNHGVRELRTPIQQKPKAKQDNFDSAEQIYDRLIRGKQWRSGYPTLKDNGIKNKTGEWRAGRRTPKSKYYLTVRSPAEDLSFPKRLRGIVLGQLLWWSSGNTCIDSPHLRDGNRSGRRKWLRRGRWRNRELLFPANSSRCLHHHEQRAD